MFIYFSDGKQHSWTSIGFGIIETVNKRVRIAGLTAVVSETLSNNTISVGGPVLEFIEIPDAVMSCAIVF